MTVPFDKGVGICVMRKETYEKKLMDILRLNQFEKWVKPRKNSKDLIVKEEERINDELSQLLRDGAISEELRGELKSKGGQPIPDLMVWRRCTKLQYQYDLYCQCLVHPITR